MFIKTKIIIYVILMSLALNISYASDTEDVQTEVNNMRNSTLKPGILGNIITKIFDTEGKIKNIFLSIFESSTEGYIPFWQDGKLKDSIIYSTGGKLSLGTETPREMLTVKNGISIGKDPNSDDDVGNRGFNDGRYVNVGEEIDGDLITDGTIDSTEIENNSIGEEDISDSFIARNSDLFDNKNSTGTVTDSDDWIPTSKAVKDYVDDNSSSSTTKVEKLDDLIDGVNDEESIFIGFSGGLNDEGETYNVGIGNKALYSNTDGEFNLGLGYKALYSNTDGDDNIAIGNKVLYNLDGGDRNIGIGTEALYSNTDGNDNIAQGYRALYYNDDGDDNIAIGSYSLYNNIGGRYNLATGYKALYSNTEGDYNVANGQYALYSNTEGNYNLGIGTNALYSNTEGNGNIALGISALYSNIEGDYNSAVGSGALYNNTEGEFNLANGTNSLYSNTTGNENVGIGINSLYSNTTGNENVGIGESTLYNNEIGIGNVAIGYNAGYYETGSNTLYIANSSTSQPLIYGNFEEKKVVINDDLEVVGNLSWAKGPFGTIDELDDGNTGPSSLYLGEGAGENSLKDDEDEHKYKNIGIGNDALNALIAGKENIAIGYQSLNNLETGTGNTIIGMQAGIDTNEASFNTGIGTRIIFKNTTGTKNVALGYQALFGNTTGTGNVAIGYNAGYGEDDSNKLYIDNEDNGDKSLIYGDFEKNKIIINGSIRVGMDVDDRCDSNNTGKIKYDNTDNEFYLCVVDTWKKIQHD